MNIKELLDTTDKIPRALKPAQEMRRNEVIGYLSGVRSQQLKAEKLADVNLKISDCGNKILYTGDDTELTYEEAVRYIQIQTGWELR